MTLDVLSVDDDKLVLFIHQRIMKHSQFSTFPKAFEDGYDAINYIAKEKSHSLKFLIFLDLKMPSLDGWGILEELERQKLDEFCYVFVLTSSIDYRDEERVTKHTCVLGFLEKPLSIDKLLDLKLTKELSAFFD